MSLLFIFNYEKSIRNMYMVYVVYVLSTKYKLEKCMQTSNCVIF